MPVAPAGYQVLYTLLLWCSVDRPGINLTVVHVSIGTCNTYLSTRKLLNHDLSVLR